MAKRFAIIFFITLGTILFVVTSSVLILFIAPGARLFGLRYVLVNTHYVDKVISVTDTFGTNFNGSIEVYANEIQINVCFVSGGKYSVRYHDNYSGVTDSEYDDPSVDLSLKGDGTLKVEVHEYNTVIFQNANTERYININIPIDYVYVNKSIPSTDKNTIFNRYSEGGAYHAYETDLKIYTNESLIKFEQDKSSMLIPTFRTLHIETNGAIDTENRQVKCLNYELVTLNSVHIDETPTIRVNAQNYDIVAGGSVKFDDAVVGNIKAESKFGNVRFVRCQNLMATTDVGYVGASTSAGATVLGDANIKTTSGKVNVDVINGTGESRIETVSGDIKLGKIKNDSQLIINTRRGSVDIETCAKAKIESNFGGVNVGEATSSLEVNTTYGKILAGKQNTGVKNLTAQSVIGKIEATNVSGKVEIKTAESDVKVVGNAITSTDIDVGGSLYISGVAGKTDIAVGKSSEIWFSDESAIYDATNISGGEKCEEIQVYLPQNTIKRTRYVIETHSVMAYIFEFTPTSTPTWNKGFLSENSPSGINPLLHITGQNTGLKIYFKGN